MDEKENLVPSVMVVVVVAVVLVVVVVVVVVVVSIPSTIAVCIYNDEPVT